MAIEDFYTVLEILQNNKIENTIDKQDNWETIFTCQGIVNTNNSTDVINGKIMALNTGKAFLEVSEETKTITSANRLKQNGYIYKILGNPNNTLLINHHLLLNIEFTELSQE